MGTKSRTGRGEEEGYSVKKVTYDDGTQRGLGISFRSFDRNARCFQITSGLDDSARGIGSNITEIRIKKLDCTASVSVYSYWYCIGEIPSQV
jgi:hypothetical protein